MSESHPTSFSNRLLARLDAADFALLQPHLRHIELSPGMPIVEPHARITHVWFPESGIISVVAAMPDGRRVEAGLIGREGMVDIATVNGADSSPLECMVQSHGHAWRMAADDLRHAMEESPSLRLVLARWVQAFVVQVAHTSFANASNTVEGRLARWLLMAEDRVGSGAAIAMTHEFLAVMLGVRRAGVTAAVRKLAAMRLIEPGRGRIVVLDREHLKSVSNDVYGPPEAEYRRLIEGGGRDSGSFAPA